MLTYSINSQFSMSEIDLNKLIKEIASLTKLKAWQMDINFDVHFSEDSVVIIGNEEKLKQVLINLLTNALEATPYGENIVITAKLKKNPDLEHSSYAEIEITNTGKRIHPDDLNKIFEPFYTTKHGGLGLGLSISKEIIDRHQGSIKAVSEDEGTSFIITLPMKQMTVERRSFGHMEI